jgi:hypothetical protein
MKIMITLNIFLSCKRGIATYEFDLTNKLVI